MVRHPGVSPNCSAFSAAVGGPSYSCRMTPEELAAAGLRYAVDGPVATITLDRPEVRNAQTPRMWRMLAAIGAEIPDDVRVVLVRGAGHSFSAGLDRAMLDGTGTGTGTGTSSSTGTGTGTSTSTGDGVESVAAMTALGDDEMSAAIEAFQRGFTFLRDPRFVSIAVVQGHALGAGFQLALSCDLRVVSEDARFAMLESTLGLVPDLTGTKPLVDSVGYARALEICVTAREVGAAEAAAIGLATVVCPPAELDETVADLVGALTAPPPGAVREVKALLLAASSRTLDEQRQHEREAQVRRLRELCQTMSGSSATRR
jgi:enoyl-CoA hydratase/carnithine racemase